MLYSRLRTVLFEFPSIVPIIPLDTFSTIPIWSANPLLGCWFISQLKVIISPTLGATAPSSIQLPICLNLLMCRSTPHSRSRISTEFVLIARKLMKISHQSSSYCATYDCGNGLTELYVSTINLCFCEPPVTPIYFCASFKIVNASTDILIFLS